MKNFEELNIFEIKKMILEEMGFIYIPHNSDINQKPFRNSNVGYYVLKQWLEHKHYYNFKFDILSNTKHNIKFFSNVLPKNNFNPESNWNDLFYVIKFLFDKEIYENKNGCKLRTFNDVFDIISKNGEIKLTTINETFNALSLFIYNRINNIYD